MLSLGDLMSVLETPIDPSTPEPSTSHLPGVDKKLEQLKARVKVIQKIYADLGTITMDSNPVELVGRIRNHISSIVGGLDPDSNLSKALILRSAISGARSTGCFCTEMLQGELGELWEMSDEYKIADALYNIPETLFVHQECLKHPEYWKPEFEYQHPGLNVSDKWQITHDPYGICIVLDEESKAPFAKEFGYKAAHRIMLTPQIPSGDKYWDTQPTSIRLIVAPNHKDVAFPIAEVIDHDLITERVKPFLKSDESRDPIEYVSQCLAERDYAIEKNDIDWLARINKNLIHALSPQGIATGLKEEIVLMIANREVPGICDPSKWTETDSFTYKDIHGASPVIDKTLQMLPTVIEDLPEEIRDEVNAQSVGVIDYFDKLAMTLHGVMGVVHRTGDPARYEEALAWMIVLRPIEYKNIPEYMDLG